MLISAEHQKLLEKCNNLVLRQYQFDEVVRKKDEQLSHQAGEITTLKNVFDQLAGSFKELSSKYEDILSELANLPEGAVKYGTEETEQLEYDPGKLFVTVYLALQHHHSKHM